MLDWSRLQRGVIKFEPENIALRTLVDFNIQLNRANTSIKQIKINNEVPEELNVFADRQMLSTVIRNLISNSVKFSYKESNIDIFAEETESEVIVSIKDYGIGMSQELLDISLNLTPDIARRHRRREKFWFGLILCKNLLSITRAK